MGPLVIADFQPGGEGPIELVEREDVADTGLGFELALHRLEEPFDQPARRRIAWRPVQQLDVQGVTSRLQAVGLVDLGVVHVQLAAGSMHRPPSQQRVDQDVQGLPVVVTSRDDVPAVTIDEGRQMGAHRLAVLEHERSFFEIAEPQRVGLLVRPSAADLGAGEAKFQTCRPGLLQVAKQGRFGNRLAELGLKKLVDGFVGTEGLFLFQFDGPFDHLRRMLAGSATVAARLAGQALEALILIHLPFAPQGGERHFAASTIRKEVLFFGDFSQPARGLGVAGLAEDQWPQHRTPEQSQNLVFLGNASPPIG